MGQNDRTRHPADTASTDALTEQDVDTDDGATEPAGHHIGDMSPRDFAQLGVNDVAYIRAVRVDDQGNETDDENASVGWSIHAADGERIGMAPGRDLAVAATLQHDMQPLSVH